MELGIAVYIHALYYCVFLYLSTPVEGKWDFAPAKNRFVEVSCRVLAITNSTVTVTVTEAFKDKKINQVLSFPFHQRLLFQSYNLLDHDEYSYTRKDLRVGDSLVIKTLKLENELEFCVSFCIRSRPEGIIPPTQQYKPTDWKPYHEWMNARAASQKTGVSMPRHLLALAKKYEFPAFDPEVSKSNRLKRFPFDRPFTYYEYLVFMR